MCARLLTWPRPRILSDQRATATILLSPPAVLVHVPHVNLLSTIAYGLMLYRHRCLFLRSNSVSQTGNLRDNSYNNTNPLDSNYRYRQRPSTSIPRPTRRNVLCSPQICVGSLCEKASSPSQTRLKHRSRSVHVTHQLHSKRLVLLGLLLL